MFKVKFVPCYCGSRGYLSHTDQNSYCPRTIDRKEARPFQIRKNGKTVLTCKTLKAAQCVVGGNTQYTIVEVK